MDHLGQGQAYGWNRLIGTVDVVFRVVPFLREDKVARDLRALEPIGVMTKRPGTAPDQVVGMRGTGIKLCDAVTKPIEILF